MARKELAQEIRKRMYTDHTTKKIDRDVCEQCGSFIDKNPHIEMIPEHGEDTEYRVVWCNKSCKSEWISDSL